MFKKVILLLTIITIAINTVNADVNKVAIVDLQKVVSKSAQVKALQKEQAAKQKEIAQFIGNANAAINKQTTEAAKKATAKKYETELKTKQANNAKTYKTKLDTISKNIDATIAKQAKAMGYDIVLNKNAVLYGGDDITEAILKIIK